MANNIVADVKAVDTLFAEARRGFSIGPHHAHVHRGGYRFGPRILRRGHDPQPPPGPVDHSLDVPSVGVAGVMLAPTVPTAAVHGSVASIATVGSVATIDSVALGARHHLEAELAAHGTNLQELAAMLGTTPHELLAGLVG